MAGGRFLDTNKVLPGMYINFVSVPKAEGTIGDRGIATLMLPLSWGSTSELIEVFSPDLRDGNSLSKVGYTAFDEESKILRAMASYCYKILIFNPRRGGVKATESVGDLTVTANYEGSFGNEIVVTVSAADEMFEVKTYAKGSMVDTQNVMIIEELKNNKFVTFSGAGDLTETAGATLNGGEDGTIDEALVYPEYLTLLGTTKWQNLAVLSEDSSIQGNVIEFIKSQVHEEGRYVCGTVANHASVDNRHIINVFQTGAIIQGEEFTPYELTAVAAAMDAGASIVDDNTNSPILYAEQITNPLTKSEQEEAIKKGRWVLATRQNGMIVVLEEINSLHTFTKKEDDTFRSCQTMRLMNEIGTTQKARFEENYLGSVSNTESGRRMYRSDIISYMMTLERISAIQNVDVVNDVAISFNSSDAWDVETYFQPANKVHKAYMNVNVYGGQK